MLVKDGSGAAPIFEHGVYFVPLAPLARPELVASAIAQALGVREAGGRPLLETLPGFLGDRPLLLVLDNFEHLLAGSALVAELLGGCPGLKVLATSRAPLHLYGEHEYGVPPLALVAWAWQHRAILGPTTADLVAGLPPTWNGRPPIGDRLGANLAREQRRRELAQHPPPHLAAHRTTSRACWRRWRFDTTIASSPAGCTRASARSS